MQPEKTSETGSCDLPFPKEREDDFLSNANMTIMAHVYGKKDAG